MVSRAWKGLSAEEREEWEEMARRDKARYEVEKTMYTGPWKVPAKKRSQKDPNAPKRPMSAFLSFSNSKRAQVKEEHPNIGNAEVSRILAQMWKDAPDDERKEHIDKEYKLRQQYKTAIAAWRKNCENELEAARKVREDEALRTVLATASKTTDDQTEYDYGAQHFEEYPGGRQHQYQHPPQGGPPMQGATNSGQPNAGQHPYPGHHHQAYAPPGYPHHYGYGGGYDEPPSQADGSPYPPPGGQYHEKGPPPPADGYAPHYYAAYGHPPHHPGYGKARLASLFCVFHTISNSNSCLVNAIAPARYERCSGSSFNALLWWRWWLSPRRIRTSTILSGSCWPAGFLSSLSWLLNDATARYSSRQLDL